jgi:hypothetical protein
MRKTLFLTLVTAFAFFAISVHADEDCTTYGATDLGANTTTGQSNAPSTNE